MNIFEAWASGDDRSVIFDFNGTLSNDEPLLVVLFQELFMEYLDWPLSDEEYFSDLAGRSDREIIESAVEARAPGDHQLVETLMRERRLRYLDLVERRSPIEDDTVAMVDALRSADVPLAIVTGAQRIDVEFVLRHRGLGEVFSAIVTEEDVSHGKPDPEGFLLGAALLGTEPADALVFEDSLYGIRSAKAAGMRCVGVVGTSSAEELSREADAVVEALGPWLIPSLDEGSSAAS